MTLANAVGSRVREILSQKKITAYRLARLTCLSDKTILDLLNGKTTDIKFSTIYLIANALDISLMEFFNSKFFKAEKITF